MFYQQIENKRNLWLKSKDCTINEMIEYIIERGMMRDAQVEAIKTYLFLKIACINKPLWALFAEGFFNTKDLNELEISTTIRTRLKKDSALLALFEYASSVTGNGEENAPALKKSILAGEHIESIEIIKKMFYGVSYTDYLFSLPMGAGKTYLMASFILLDLYFAIGEPENKAFAHNFIVFAPSGMKSSVVPSLKQMKKFDPTWILPEPAASNVYKLIKFEVLDEQRAQTKSNRAKNPNAQKINNYQPISSLMGLVAVTNAEKVIMDRLKVYDGKLYELTEDEKDRHANELRNLIGKIPNLAIYIDEVHHAMDDDIKLRAVVNNWMSNDTVNSIIGFSGTPYLEKADTIQITEGLKLKNSELSNVVYYYPLIKGIGNFLKAPEIHISSNRDSMKIVEQGVRGFLAKYINKVYSGGLTSKLAIYCGSIERLETQVYPLVADILSKHGIGREVIVKYHQGNKSYKVEEGAQLEFESLDTNISKIRIVLLVQIGKEGWDCKSLTGIILSQEGDCPKNMVLQTSCRCLRQVVKGVRDTADIWLNSYNASILNEQLTKQQHITIEQLNNAISGTDIAINRHSRIDVLNLPKVDFYQLRLQFQNVIEVQVDVATEIENVLSDDTINQAIIQVQDISGVVHERRLEDEYGDEATSMSQWLYLIAKEGLGTVTMSMLRKQQTSLNIIFDLISHKVGQTRFYSSKYNQELVRSKIRQSFAPKYVVTTTIESLHEETDLLRIGSLISPTMTREPELYYPNSSEVDKIIKADNNEIHLDESTKQTYESLIKLGETELAHELLSKKCPPEYINRTYHYLPYKFDSDFELHFLGELLSSTKIKEKGLEIYYNGDRGLTDFKIKCYKKGKKDIWKYLGEYTPDFLLIQRKDGIIFKLIIVETKGSIYSNDMKFLDKKVFMEGEFMQLNDKQFGYKRFDYLYIEDSLTEMQRLQKIETAVKSFFN